MSTLDISCDRCEKKFRVRAEFAGRSTRCPGCSAPLTIAKAAAAPRPRRQDDDDAPRHRPAPRDDDSSATGGDWRPVATAFRREQTVLTLIGVQVLFDLLGYCLTTVLGERDFNVVGIAFVILFVVGPAALAGIFGIMARLSASKTPQESRTKGAAVVSLLCSIAALGSLAVFGLILLATMDRTGPPEGAIIVGLGGFFLSSLAALVTFAGFIAQVGVALKSKEIGAAIGRTTIAAGVCVLVLVGVGVMYAVLDAVFTPAYRRGTYGNNHEGFYRVFLGGMVPIAAIVMIIMYHRLLAAGRRALSGHER